MSIDQLFDENHLLRVELTAVRDELGATLRAKVDTETNLQAANALLNAERETVRVLRSDNGALSQTNNGYQRDNSAFHSENVDVRVRVVELTEQNTELTAAAKMAERERTSFEQQLQAATAQYNDLATKLRFATEEYGLKTSPVRVAAGDGRVDLMSNYLRRVAEDHPQAQSAAPTSTPASTGKAAASGGCRYLEARGTENTFRANKGNKASYLVPSKNVGWSSTVLRTEGVTTGARPAGDYVSSPYSKAMR